MNFQLASKFLIKSFRQHNFAENVRNNKRHVSQIVVEICTNDTEILVSFPGYKAAVTSEKIVYDYRVDIRKGTFVTSLSHANIITDIYNKIVYGGMEGLKLRKALIYFFKEGGMSLADWETSLYYTSRNPEKDLLERVKTAHAQKQFNLAGNTFDLSLEELFCSLKWIVLQEDINYPMARGYEGRKMPLARYLETIFVTANHKYSLEDVIRRALMHKRPLLWPELKYPFKTR